MKLFILNRGIPGSGKTTFIKTFKKMCKTPVIVHSTDDLWIKDGKYQFDFNLIKSKHEENYNNFIKSLNNEIDVIFCDNTNIKKSEYTKYINSAKEHGYKVVSIVFYPDILEKHYERNTHGVPFSTLNNMRTILINNLITENVDNEFLIYPEYFTTEIEKIINIINNL